MLSDFDLAYVLAWARAFAFTEIVEAPIYWRLARVRWWRALAASAITHPFVWFAFPLLTKLDVEWSHAMLSAEVFAWLVEAVFLRATRPAVPLVRAALISLVANGASVTLGLVSRKLLGLP